MIKRLRSQYKWRNYWRNPNVRTFTDREIMQALGLDRKRFNACVRAAPAHSGRPWNKESCLAAFEKFVDKEKRWPHKKDFRNWRQTGLPYPETTDNWCRDWGNNVRGSVWVVDEYCRKYPHRVTTMMAMSIPNLTTRRNVLQRLGAKKLLKEGGGKVVQQDDFGKLWRIDATDGVDNRIQFVEVVNKSPRINEDTGRVVVDRKGNLVFDHYFLRVPPDIRSAKDAVAWTVSVPAERFVGFAAES
jgi:hypothetical protein